MAPNLTDAMHGSCACGTCTFQLKEAPKVRLICHCTICQAFTGNDVSDVIVFPASKATRTGLDNVTYRKYRKFRLPPPNLSRGRCKTCGKPVIEIGGVWPMQIFFLPAANFKNPALLPPAEGHLFYEHRRHDYDDGIPKHEGYYSSQAAIAKMIMHAM